MADLLELRKFSNKNSEKNSKMVPPNFSKSVSVIWREEQRRTNETGLKTSTGAKWSCLRATEQGSTENANISRQNFILNYAEKLLKG